MSIIKHLFVTHSDNTVIQLFRYTFVGGIAFICDFGSLYILTEYCHLHYLISAAVAFIFGLSVNYILSIMWVFTQRSVKSKYVEFMIFAVIGLVGLLFNELFIWTFTEFLGIHYMGSKLISTVMVYLWNFFARKYLLFQ